MLKLFMIVTLFSAMVWPSEAKSWDHSTWMSGLDGTKLITQISIPGTHDSAADGDNCAGRLYCQAQRYDFSTQLDKGVRFFDIRLAYEYGVLRFYHKIYYLHQHFGSAINAAQDFLTANPSEFVIFLIKQEHTSVSANTFWDLANSLYFNYSKYDGLFYLDKRVPTVEEARGKIIIMGREGSYHPQGYHVHWDDNTTHYEGASWNTAQAHPDVLRYIVEDHYSLATVPTDTKFAWIAQNLHLAGVCTTCGYQKTLYITFLSGEGDKALKGPSHYADYENPHTASWLNSSPYSRSGIVVIDFAGDPDHDGDTVVSAVINQNTFVE